MKYSFEEKKHRISVAAALMFVCVLGLVYIFSGRFRDAKTDGNTGMKPDESAVLITETDNHDALQDKEPDKQGIMVHVCGAVKNPGVYELDNNSRIKDAIDMAGGFNSKADKEYLNLAENVTDGQKIIVYTKKQTKSSEKSGLDVHEDGNRGSGKVNINTASKDELMTLTGVGESKANDIIAYREQNGGFKSINELMNISGIKEGVYSKISDSITVDGF